MYRFAAKLFCVFHLSCLTSFSVGDFECFLVYMCPSDAPTTLPPSTTPPLHPIPADPTALLGTRASDPALAGNRGTVPPDTSPQALPLRPLSFPLRFLLPCKHFTFAILISCQGSEILSPCIQKGFLLSKYSIYCPLGISETSVLLCPQTSKKQMSDPAENVWPQETSHHQSKRCVRA